LVLAVPPRPAAAGTTRDFLKTLGCEGESAAKTWAVQQAGCSLPANILYPGESVTFTYQFENRADQPLQAKGRALVVRYATETDPFNGFEVASRLLDTVEAIPFELDLAPKAHTAVPLSPKTPAAFGGYALVLELEGRGRAFGSAFVCVPPATPGAVQHPSYALDINPWRNTPPVWVIWKRLGIKGTRQEWGGGPQDLTDPKRIAEQDRIMAGMKEHDITVMLTLSDGGFKQPLEHWRPWLNDKDEMLDTKFDMAALPETDPEFRKWVAAITARYGWPKGPLNAVELWNEPWEGISISGWGADLPRYRDLYTAMAQGVEDARRDAGVKVLIGGACSSMNTEDKLFCDGTDTFLPWLDFFSIHYQPLCPWGALKPDWMERKGEYGPVRPWDTESWFANSEDRVLPAIAAMRASGLQRTAGVLHDLVYDVREFDRWDGDQKTRAASHDVLAPGAAIAAVQHFIGERAFRELLFQKGLPWVFVFDGLPDPATGAARPDDGTVVVIGDLGASHDRRMLPFRGVLGLEARQRARALQVQLDALPPDSKDRPGLERKLALAQVLDAATLTFKPEPAVQALDFYGNPLPRQGDSVVVPLNGTGYFLRTGGGAGTMEKLLAALRQAEIRGYEPVELKARDFLGRIEKKPALRVTVANVFNREIRGKLTVRAQGLTLATPEQDLTLAPHEAREIAVAVTGGRANASNLYRTEVAFDAGADGRAALAEALRVNLVEARTIKVDGKLNDWKNALPQSVTADASVERNLTEKAWLPFVKFDEKTPSGFATAYLAADEQFLYFAAKIADNTPYPGGVRFETRNDDVYYYPEVSYEVRRDQDGKETSRREFRWPAGVRRYSYRRGPDLPSGDGTDNLQLGFGVFPPGSNGMYTAAPGVMPGFIAGKVTDYEYALNPVATNYGGGAEIWRLLAPGVPNKHYYPRQPKAPRDGGPVKDGQLVMAVEGTTRIVEAALPWTEIPDVKRALDAGQPVRFTYRANNNGAPALELNANRSVSRINTYALHDLWSHSWEPQAEFVLEKR
jgi:hypothetical protein